MVCTRQFVMRFLVDQHHQPSHLSPLFYDIIVLVTHSTGSSNKPYHRFQSHFDCESCHLGKHHRATFRSLRLVSSQSLFELIHCDIQGPARVPSVSSHKYYIVFVDDYSHVSWIYILKDRVHVFDVIQNFFTEIKNQFSVTPKYLRTDNALKFIQSGIQSYCASLGVIHQTTCLHTSQQNSVIERQHRHRCHTIMLQMKILKYLR